MSFPRLCTATTTLLLALVGCASGEEPSSGFTASNPTGVTGVTSKPGTDTGEPATSAGGTTGDAVGGSSGETTGPTTGTTTGIDTAPNPDGLPNDAECMSPAQCMTGNCYKITIPVDGLPPGICSECDEDADCVAAGSGISCTVDVMTLGGACTDGGLGSYCETQAACQPQFFCDPIVDGAEGLLPDACNECRVDSDCVSPERCVPAIDVATYSGQKSCVAPGGVANDGLCPLSNGDPMCASGFCNILDVGGLIMIGVCGQCATDGDCMKIGKTTCTAGKFDGGFLGSVCT